MRSAPEHFNEGMDPYDALGVRPDATAEELARAYRDLAKALHPDVRPGDLGAAQRMAEVNAAYAAVQRGADGPRPAPPAVAADPGPRPAGEDRARLRRILGGELARALHLGEAPLLVTDAATWDSHRVRLVATERRLLWLLDDLPVDRVRALPYAAIAGVSGRLRRPRRRVGELLVQPRSGRRLSFSELDPDALRALVLTVKARLS